MKVFISFIFAFSVLAADQNKQHEIWWQNCVGSKVSWQTFSGWLGGIDAESRIAMRNHVKQAGYESIVDIPCGLCIDYWGLVQEGIGIQYTGVDITSRLVEYVKRRGAPAVVGSIEKIPYPDNAFDMSYARHILEHLDSYQAALTELIRVAKKEAFITFFIKPSEGLQDGIVSNWDRGFLLYHNQYSRPKMEEFIKMNPKVAEIVWEDVNSAEVILHIYLRND
jgi:ubiquinone/menaquinone biosynthesis C-methylase UbiE